MSHSPLVSVVIPAYNASAWISDTISSVIAQDYKDYEIIVVDDGSTDDTANVIASFGEKVQYIHKPNGGQASARNAGIKAARGKYVAFLDADDLWTKEKLSLQIELLESTNAKWVYSYAFVFDDASGKTLFIFGQPNRQYEGNILKPLFNACFIPSPTPVIQRSVFAISGLFNENSYMRNREDWEMWLRIAAIYPIALIPLPLAYYRIHSASVTGSESLFEQMNANIVVIEEAALREPNRLAPMKNLVISKIYFKYGLAQALLYQTVAARELFNKSIRLTPRWIPPYLFWLMSPVVPWIKKLRNKLCSAFLRKFGS